MLRTVAGTLAGVAGWILVASLINRAMRLGWPDYALVEMTYHWTLPMQICRLVNGTIAGLFAGFIAARVGNGQRAALFAGLGVLLLTLPVHYLEFDKMPLWYHAVFLLTVMPLALLGGRMAFSRV